VKSSGDLAIAIRLRWGCEERERGCVCEQRECHGRALWEPVATCEGNGVSSGGAGRVESQARDSCRLLAGCCKHKVGDSPCFPYAIGNDDCPWPNRSAAGHDEVGGRKSAVNLDLDAGIAGGCKCSRYIVGIDVAQCCWPGSKIITAQSECYA